MVSVGGKPLGKQYNLEFRPMDATACPHLAMAVVLIAGCLASNDACRCAPWPMSIRMASGDEERQACGIRPCRRPSMRSTPCNATRALLCRAAKALLDTYLAMSATNWR